MAAKAVHTDKQDHGQAIKTSSADPPAAVEPTLTYTVTGTASTGPNSISTGNSGTTIWYGAARSDSGTCFYVKDDRSTGTTYSSGSTCTATATAAASAAFTSKW